ncbi:MAG: GAF domain-containing protein [Frankia sp.]
MEAAEMIGRCTNPPKRDGLMAGDTDLDLSLSGLSDLVLARPLETVLTRIAKFGVSAIPGADGAGLALVSMNDRPDTVVATAGYVGEVDDVQYAVNEGPCVEACRSGKTQMSGDIRTDSRWPVFAAAISEREVASALSLPLLFSGRTLGCLNVYAQGVDVFTADALRIGELFADPAAVAVASADLLVKNRARIAELTDGLMEETAVFEAVGIVRGRTGRSSEEALLLLRQSAHALGVDLDTFVGELNTNPKTLLKGGQTSV